MFDEGMKVESLQALRDYFNHLSKTGYMRYDTVFKLVVFMFFDEMLNQYLNVEMDEEDYNIVSNAMLCLYGTCLLPYPEYISNIPYVNNVSEVGTLRETENNILRNTENSEFRITELGTKLIG